MSEDVRATFPELALQHAASLVSQMNQDLPFAVQGDRARTAQVVHLVEQGWGRLLDDFLGCRLAILGALQAARVELRSAAFPQDLTTEAVARILVRSLGVAEEVETLLRAGMSDGAEARARSIYEMATVAVFLYEWNDPDLARRYGLHRVFAAAKEWVAEHKERPAAPPLDMLRAYYSYQEQHGGFRGDYGWAYPAILKNGVPVDRPSFSDITDVTRHDDWTRLPWVRGSGHIHAGSLQLHRLDVTYEGGGYFRAGAAPLNISGPLFAAISELYIVVQVLFLHEWRRTTLASLAAVLLAVDQFVTTAMERLESSAPNEDTQRELLNEYMRDAPVKP